MTFIFQSLSTVEETNGKNSEEQLVALRNHLLALGKSETHIQDVKDNSFESRPSVVTETSIVEILELWQTVFRETFQQYHRLSSQLVRSQDGVAALRLWQEYLYHVQSFLSGTIPEDYHNLKEQKQLCEIHQNLLATQKSVLNSKNDGSNKDDLLQLSDNAVMEQFSSLTNLHNETLSRIMDRHEQINERITSWDKYRIDQAKLLQWLKDMEREREKLQLRYIHMRRVPKILHRIQFLIDKVPAGQAQANALLAQQKNLLGFCEDPLAASIRIEYTGIVKRIENLEAGLHTWRDYINRIILLISDYESQITSLQTVLAHTQKSIPQSVEALPKSRSETKDLLDKLREYRKNMANLVKDLDSLSVIQEQLKDCVSPQDNKTISQRIWILRQQQADLDHQLSVLIHQLEEKLELNLLFDSRHSRFVIWITDLESRLDKESKLGFTKGLKPEDLLHKLECDLKSDMVLKEPEIKWITNTGLDLINSYGKDETDQQSVIKQKVDTVNDKWNRLKQVGNTRTKKIRDLLQTILQLEIRLSKIREWLSQTESQLWKPLYVESFTKDVFNKNLEEHDKLQAAIEEESGEIGDVLNLYELLLNDVDTWNANFDTQNLKLATENVERRWKIVCEQSTERKRRIVSIWSLLQELIKLSNEEEEWLQRQEQSLRDIEQSIEGLPSDRISETISKIETLIDNVNSRSPALQILEHTYSKLAKTSGLEPENLQNLISRVRSMIIRWNNLIPSAVRLLGLLRQDTAMHRKFVDAHGKAVVGLTQVDVHLTQIQHLPRRQNIKHQKQQLEVITRFL